MHKFLMAAAFAFAAIPAGAEDIAALPGQSKAPAEAAEVITHKVEVPEIPLPACNDKGLLSAVKKFVADYYSDNLDQNVRFRRHRYFTMRNLDRFSEENVGNYKTEKTRPVSDVVADIKINQGVAESNIRICKNQNPYTAPKNIYLIIYPEEEAYRCLLINLSDEQGDFPSFTYKKEQ